VERNGWYKICGVSFFVILQFIKRPSTQVALFLRAFAKLRKATIGFVMSVRPSARMEQLGSHGTDFHEVSYLRVYRKYVHKSHVSLKSNTNNKYSTWRRSTFMVSYWILLRKRNASDKSCRENQNTHFVFGNFFFFLNRALYERMWKNILDRGMPQMTIWRMRIACWVPKATNTHTLRLSNTHCSSTTTMVARMRLSINVIFTLPVSIYY
jgi:hypothetical protein